VLCAANAARKSTQTGITDFIGHPDLVAERLVR
jgi:hypothetical protein